FFPASVRLTASEPEPAQATDHLEWSFAELAAGEERAIHITMIPSQRGDLATTANVRFTGTAASIFKVEEPLLKLAVQAPADAVVGDPLVQTITVTNPGTGVAQNVKIRVMTPDGLEQSHSDRSQVEIGALSPGESRTLRLSFTATAGGEQTLTVEASADSGLKQSAATTVNVITPLLHVAIEGPELRYVGRDARYTLTVTNEGNAATNNVRVSHRIPKGFKFVKADKGGTFDASTGSVNWFVGHLKPEQTAPLKLQLQATELGQFEHHVTATSEHGLIAKADTITKIEGSAALVMEIQDLEDRVEVGQETAYEIRVSNTGSKAAENVGLTFELPNGLELLNVHSATEHMAKNGLILFNDLPALAPGKTALYRIHVKGHMEGSQRVRARLTSESIDQELISEKLTKFYAD
ncbi:MAG TPA: CARDB domain-containing protein, partial [Planctomycetaceae bacterium]|nr:CARDB domain-containing protein [Planctomycetaceae bacterium]